MKRLANQVLHSFYEEIAGALGAAPEEAAIFARCIARADLRGKMTQGGAIVPYLASLVEDGLARFRAPWSFVTDRGGRL